MKEFTPPDHLDEIGLAQWEKYVVFLQDREDVTEQDMHSLEVFCVNFSVFRQAWDSIKEHGLIVKDSQGGLRKNPAILIKNDSEKLLYKYASILGFDPVSRARLSVAPTDDQFELLLDQ